MLRSLASRRALPLAVLLAVTVSLAGCGKDKGNGSGGGSDEQAAGCGFKSGASSNAVKVSGDFGKDVKTSFDKPLAAASLQRTVVTEGSGPATKKGDNLSLVVSLFNGKDGKLLDHGNTEAVVGDAGLQDIARASIECAKIGSRIVSTFAAKDIFGDAGNPGIGVAASDALIRVTDIVEKVVPPKATGWDDAPTVTFDGRKSPEVTLPSTLPTDLAVHVIKAGDGAEVAATDTVTLNYKGINATTGKVFDQTYGKGKAPATYPVSVFVAGFKTALIGQRGGTQLIVSIPPQFGYGAGGNPNAGIKPTDTMVFVIEIQATKAAS